MRRVGHLGSSEGEEPTMFEVSIRLGFGHGSTDRKRKVPMNSPTMAMKWLRGPLGIRLKNGMGLGPAISFEGVSDKSVFFRGLNTPGRNPVFA